MIALAVTPPAPSQNKPASNNVELDLDDAPFLKEDSAEIEKTPENASDQKTEGRIEEDPEEKSEKLSLLDKLKAKKKIIIIAGAALLLVIVAIIVILVVFGKKKPVQEKITEPEVVAEKPKETPPAKEKEAAPEDNAPKYIMEWDPFEVEVTDPEGEIRIFYCKFSFPTNDQSVAIEMQSKMLIMRDGIFHYLRNRPYEFLATPANIPALKDGVMSVINSNIRFGKLENVLIENYQLR